MKFKKDKVDTAVPKSDLKEQKKKPPKPAASTLDLVPFRCFAAEDDYILTADNAIVDMVQIMPRNLRNSNIDDRELAIYDFAVFLRGFSADFKIITMNYPADTTSQRKHIQSALDNCENNVYEYFLSQKLGELERVEQNVTDQEYYLMFFADTAAQYSKYKDDINEMLGRVLSVQPVSRSKKIRILAKLSNISSKIVTE